MGWALLILILFAPAAAMHSKNGSWLLSVLEMCVILFIMASAGILIGGHAFIAWLRN